MNRKDPLIERNPIKLKESDFVENRKEHVASSVSFRFDAKTVLVTGGGNGVGLEIAKLFHGAGAKVAITDVNVQAAKDAAQSLDATEATAIALELDVRRKQDFEAAANEMQQKWGRLDIVVNNAGYGKRTPLEQITAEEFDDIVAINMRSVFFSCQVFSELMKSQGYGRIINVTSLAGQNGGTVASPHYAAAKAGANMLTKYFAQLLAGTGVTVNGVAPGPIDTARGRLTQEQIQRMESLIPIGRFSSALEIASAVALLASDQGGFFVGATLDMNGGLLMR